MSLDGLNGLFMRNMYDGFPSFSLAWPETWRERITYLIILPIIIPLWLTLPDTRKPSGAALLLLNPALSLMPTHSTAPAASDPSIRLAV